MQQVEKKLIKLEEEKKQNGENGVNDSSQISQAMKRSPVKLDFSLEESGNNTDKNENLLQRTPSPASSSVSISSSANTSSETTPPPLHNNNNLNTNNNILHSHQQNISSTLANNHQLNAHSFNKCSLSLSPSHQIYQQQIANQQNATMKHILSPNRFVPSSILAQQQQQNQRYLSQQQQQQNIFLVNQQQNHIQLQQHLKQIQNTQQYNKKQNLSQSFKDILENTLMINNLNECYSNNMQNGKYANGKSGRYVKNLNKSTCSLNLNGTSNNNNNNSISFSPQHHKLLSDAILFSQMPSTNLLDIDEADLDEEIFEQSISPVLPIDNNNSNNNNNKSNVSVNKNESSFSSPIHLSQNKIPSTPILVNNQMAVKFAQLERTLEITKAQNNNLLEQQVS